MANSVKVAGVVRVGDKTFSLTGPYRATEEKAVQAFYKLYVKRGYFRYQVVNLTFLREPKKGFRWASLMMEPVDLTRVKTMAEHAGVETKLPLDGIGARW